MAIEQIARGGQTSGAPRIRVDINRPSLPPGGVIRVLRNGTAIGLASKVQDTDYWEYVDNNAPEGLVSTYSAQVVVAATFYPASVGYPVTRVPAGPPPPEPPDAELIAIPYSGAVPLDSDLKWYTFIIVTPGEYTMSTLNSPDPGDPCLALFNDAGELLAFNEDFDDNNYLAQLNLELAAGQYYLGLAYYPGEAADGFELGGDPNPGDDLLLEVYAGPPAVVTPLVVDGFEGGGVTPLASHEGEVNARWTMLFGDEPASVLVTGGVMRRPTYIEDGSNAGGERRFYLSSVDLNSGDDPVRIEFVVRRYAVAYEYDFIAIYKNGDDYGNADLIAQIGYSEVLARGDEGSVTAPISPPLAQNDSFAVKIIIDGASANIFIDDVPILTGRLGDDLPLAGKLGFSLFDSGDSTPSFGIDDLNIWGPGTVLPPP
jgi:hypothetical protein